MKIQEVVDALEQFAPLPLQESYDNAGLQVGLTEADVSGALLCLDVTEDVVDEAVRRGCNLVVSHHPLLFRGLKRISGGDYVQRAVMKAIKNDVCVVSMHTNLDNAEGGVNYKIAELLGLHEVTPLAEGGSGAVGMLAEPVEPVRFIQRVKELFGVECCMTNALLERPVRKVAVCGGAGSFLLGKALEQGADAFITGEMHYHEFFGAEQQIQIMVIGHYESEQYTTEVLRKIMTDKFPEIKTEMYGSTNPVRYW
ncbi:Nif3-like dinuclear metal center hexameric protein [Palleniella muris]|uniref:Nif3-like dinuclear metal center hexameric protein n=1 Tax=Palleniella muris TaxID=3038145 RepID=A0AC61QTW3_9BACT|nr:Nif3-like dinuclear metal center hexameric protein [Palleniella muris]TGX83870.1 Nif3-like dinuclear metal center hexameric protein [Palleniella muris]